LRSALRTLVVVGLLSGCTGLSGCAGPVEKPPMLPTRHAVDFDQLRIHCNFKLPAHHPLLDELRVQRADLLGKLSLQPSHELIHVYLFESEDKFEQFISRNHPGFPARRAFFVESDDSLTIYAQWGERVAEDLRHEVAHGYLHSVVRNIPLWLDEGLAEYCEVPRGLGGVNRPHVQLLLERLDKQGWHPDIARLEHLSEPSTMNQNDYAESWAWTQFCLETTPERRALVQGYLHLLARGEKPAPLGQVIHQAEPNIDQLLIDHLRELGARP
jgi:hypothetical protein